MEVTLAVLEEFLFRSENIFALHCSTVVVLIVVICIVFIKSPVLTFNWEIWIP